MYVVYVLFCYIIYDYLRYELLIYFCIFENDVDFLLLYDLVILVIFKIFYILNYIFILIF